jgi:hypothetical protein
MLHRVNMGKQFIWRGKPNNGRWQQYLSSVRASKDNGTVSSNNDK